MMLLLLLAPFIIFFTVAYDYLFVCARGPYRRVHIKYIIQLLLHMNVYLLHNIVGSSDPYSLRSTLINCFLRPERSYISNIQIICNVASS